MARNSVSVPEDKKKLIIDKCNASKDKGNVDVGLIMEAFMLFIRNELQEIQQDVFAWYGKNPLKHITIRRALGLSTPGYVSKRNNPHLETLVDCFLGLYAGNKFTERAKMQLAISSDCKCNYYNCGNPTCGPADKPDEAYLLGEACFIHSPDRDSQRYDASFEKHRYTHISNAIWLCPAHAKLANETKDERYAIEALEKMKIAHIEAVRQYMNQFKPRPLSFISGAGDLKYAADICAFLNAQPLLFAVPEQVTGAQQLELAGKLKAYLLPIQQQVLPQSALFVYARAMVLAGNYFLNKAKQHEDAALQRYRFCAWKKILGSCLAGLSADIDLALTGDIIKLVPASLTA